MAHSRTGRAIRGAEPLLQDALGHTTTYAITGVGTVGYNYDVFNHMSSVTLNGTLGTYGYNALGERTSKVAAAGTANPGTYRYVSGEDQQLLAERTDGSNTWTNYLRFGGQPVGLIRGTAVTTLHTDQLGRPELATNSSRGTVWQSNNGAFGDRNVTTNSIGGLNLGFPGQYFDAESGLWYNTNRYYDTHFGRYTQVDPIGLAAGVNPYVYAGGNPVNRIDPYGLNTFQIGFSLGYSIGIPGTGIGTSGVIGVGAAFDSHGGLAPYGYYGGGASGGTPGADAGVQLAISNADTVQDLAGLFKNSSANGGAGAGGAADAFWGQDHTGCKDVEGAGITIGGGAGAFVFGGVTNTVLGPSGSLW